MAQSADERDDYIRNTLHSGNAVVGTCAMGRDPQQGAVVDGELRVHGIDALRVVDASVMPIMPGVPEHAVDAVKVADHLHLTDACMGTPSCTQVGQVRLHRLTRCDPASGAQTGAAAIMIAERAAGLLKGGSSQRQGSGERAREPALAGV